MREGTPARPGTQLESLTSTSLSLSKVLRLKKRGPKDDVQHVAT